MPNGIDDIRRDLEGTDFRSLARDILGDAAAMVGGTATTKYMRVGGTNVGANEKRGPGTLRRQTGRLARSLTGARSAQVSAGALRGAPEGIFDLSPTSSGVKLEYGSEVPYAGIHEYGSGGPTSVQFVSQHTRKMTQGFGDSSHYPQTVTVRAFTRVMTMPKRPYLRPALADKIEDVVEVAENKVADAILGRDPDDG